MTRQSRACSVNVIVGLLLGFFPLVISAQRQVAVQSSRDTLTMRGEERLNKPVTVNVSNVSRRQAVEAVARSANVFIQYRDRLLDKYPDRVTIHVEDVPLRTALEQALKGTPLRVTIDGGTRFVIVEDSVRAPANEKGTVAGRVIDSATGKAIAGATVAIVGTQLSAKTDDDGSFNMPNVPVGTHGISIRILGYTSKTASVTVNRGRTTTLSFALVQNSTTLAGVVTTATGIQRSYEVGSDITRINVDEVRKTNDITTVAELLATRVPGMFNQSGGGDAGAGSTLRIRGVHSISLSNDPILIIDGVRVATIGQTGTESTIGGTLSLSSRLNDIDPASIETIEVLKGPSAATLYGPDAANGVIVITRKRGLVGETRWTISGSSRFSTLPRQFPNTRTAWGRNLESNDPIPCDVSSVSFGQCVGVDSISDYSVLNDPFYTTMGRGHNNNIGLSLRTGTSTIQTSLTVRVLDQMGATKASNAAIQRMEELKGAPVPSWARRPNAQRQYTGDANVTLQSVPLFDIGIQASVVHLLLRNSGNGVSSGLMWNDSLRQTEQLFLARQTELSDGYSLSLNAQTRQWKWFNWGGTFGLQNGKVLRDNWVRAEDCISEDCSNAEGSRTKGNTTTSNYTVNSMAGVTAPLSSWGSLRSTVGLNAYRTNTEAFALRGSRMALGVSDPAAGLVVQPEAHSFQSATAGAYLEGRLEFRNRLFFNAAVRRDVGSALGQNAKTPTFPKFDVSWIALTNPIAVPFLEQLNTLRLRMSNGQSGHQPSLSDLKASILRSTAWYDGVTHPAYIYQTLGNSYINPERTNEIEMGIDLNFTRIVDELRLTYFRHITKEALVPRPVSVETGLPDLSRTENIGKLRNAGVEASASFRVIDNTFATWNLNVSFSQTKNKVLSLGSYSQVVSYGTQVAQRVVVGYPVFGIWARPILGYEDRNQDGVLSTAEVIVGDSMIFAGWSQPRYTMNYHSSLGLWGGVLRISTTLSQNTGMTRRMYLGNNSSGRSVNDLEGQALDMFKTLGLQTVSSLNWNSADVSVILPKQILRRTRARSGSVAITASNLHQWTAYRGADPNVGPPGVDNNTEDGGITPNTKNWALRFSLTY